MLGLVRRNRHPSSLRRLVSLLSHGAHQVSARQAALPSHHILCAGTYTPVFARLAAEAARAACPPELRSELRLFIHVDGVARRERESLMAWLREIPNVELTYGLFGILAWDRIPGKWHQTMVSDVVRVFQGEPHVALIDADLFMTDRAWFDLCRRELDAKVFSLSAGLRQNRLMRLGEQSFHPIKTNLFTVNTAAHLRLNQQRFSKDQRAAELLQAEFPELELHLPNMDSMVTVSLRAQAYGLQVRDVDALVGYCHVGGFSHLRMNKFYGFEAEENRATIDAWLARLRLMQDVLRYFDARGWQSRVTPSYRQNISEAVAFVRQHPYLAQRMGEVPLTRHEQAFLLLKSDLLSIF